MISRDCIITVNGNIATIDSDIYLYKYDKNIQLAFSIINSKYMYDNDDSNNLVKSMQAAYAQVKFKKNDSTDIEIEFPIQATNKGAVLLTITGELIDEDVELGDYTIQIRLLDANKNSVVTLPPVESCIHILAPLFEKLGADTNEVNKAIVNKAVARYAAPLSATTGDGTFNSKNWVDGDKITTAELNRMETGIKTNSTNQINLVEDDTSMEGIDDTVHDTLETDDKRIIGGINEVNAKLKDIVKEIGKNEDGSDIELPTTDKTIKGAITELFQNVSNGKQLIATAITDKGVTTSSDSTFQTMATNIGNISGGSGTIINMSDKTVHFSIDDFYRALNDITVNSDTYTSIFDNTTFNTLKTLHDTYGAMVICNCINHNFNGQSEHKIENVTTKFKQEFAENDWLKFAYHQNYSETYDSTTDANTVLEYYKKCHNAVLNFANECNWSYTTRLASFTGNDKIISTLSSEGVLVILSADDDRVSYGLTTTENNYLIKNGYYYKNNCLYLKTNLRYENKIFSGNDFTNVSNAVVFTHEDYLQNQLNAINTSLQWFKNNGYKFSDMQSLGEFIATVNGNAPGTTEYSITNQLTNCTSSNSDTSITAKASYTATLTANEDYELSIVTVIMGGTDITSTCYNTDTHSINITSVTGNIVITANANEVSNVNYIKDIILDGNCYFDTGIKPRGTTNIDSKFYSTTGVQNCICGCATKLETESDTKIIMARVNWSNWQFAYGYNKAGVRGLNTIATDDGYYLGSGKSDGAYGMPTELNLFIGALNVGGTSQSYVCKSGTKICYVKITIDNTVVGDFRACLDESNNPCLYDKISGQYFYNIGTGTVTYTA